MKKFIFALLSIAVITLGAYLVLEGCKRPDREPLKADFVFMLDGKQLADKSGILAQFGEQQRAMIGSMAAAKVEESDDAEYLKSAIADLNNTGITFDSPFYGYINFDPQSEEVEFVAFAEIHDIKSVDKLAKILCSISNKEQGTNYELTTNGNIRTIANLEENIMLGYNNQHIVLTSVMNGDLNASFNSAMALPYADLDQFAERDFALAIDCNSMIDLAIFNAKASGLTDQIAQLEKSRSSLGEEASATLGITFDKGRATMDVELADVNMEEYTWIKSCSNNNIDYLPQDVIAVLNTNLDGEKFMALINDYLNTIDIEAMTGVNRNEFNTYMAIAEGAISSINGDVTISLNEISGVDPYATPHIEAAVMAEVKDDYIISNVAAFGAGMLTSVEPNSYYVNIAPDMGIFLGQQADMFYTGLNFTPSATEPTAAKSRWMSDVKDSAAYMVVDMASALHSSYISMWYKMLATEFTPEAAALINSMSYIYAMNSDLYHGELAIVFESDNTNALKHIVDTLLPGGIFSLLQ